MKELNYIDLFAGCGGLSLGLHLAGWKGIFAVEKCPHAFKTLNHNLYKRGHFDWPDWLPVQHLEINRLIRSYSAQLLKLRGNVDLVTGGPPCQGFSTAGLRREGDERNKLIDSYVKFIRLVQPKMIFFENVRGFTIEFKRNRTKGKAYSEYVQKALRRKGVNFQGYNVYGEVVDFVDFGIPQKRARFILIGVRKDLSTIDESSFFEQLNSSKDEFLIDKGLQHSDPVTLGDAISDLLYSNGTTNCPDSIGFLSGKYGDSESVYQKLMKGNDFERYQLADSHRFAKHRPSTVERFRYILENSVAKNRKLDESIREKYSMKKHTVIPLESGKPSPTLTTLPDDYIHYLEPRILTVREYARIQSFPDWYEFKGKYTTGGKRRTNEVPRYSQIGNAIPPLFGEQVGMVLKKFLS